jgi:DNA-binding transcriptional regulator YdaS (Cro superfamily)
MRSPVLERLEELRKRYEEVVPKYTQRWLALQLDIKDHTLVSRWLNGKVPMPAKRREQIARLLQMRVEDVRPGDSNDGEGAAA